MSAIIIAIAKAFVSVIIILIISGLITALYRKNPIAFVILVLFIMIAGFSIMYYYT